MGGGSETHVVANFTTLTAVMVHITALIEESPRLRSSEI
jgi:hypothetical protein